MTDGARRGAPRSISYDLPERPSERLRALAAFAEQHGLDELDRYGQGAVFNRIESELTRIFGKEAAVFMPTGRLCQLVALKVHAVRQGHGCIALHPMAHLEIYERRAYDLAGGLSGVPLGHYSRLPAASDLADIRDDIAVAVLELPMLELACSLPSWEELVAFSEACRRRGIVLHVDGARLWEAAPFYRRSYREIAALFDSLYVSFYKGLNAMAGGALIGDWDLIARARVWQDRYGGVLPRFYPVALDACHAILDNLPSIELHHRRAQSLAAALARVEQIEVVPQPPHTNTFWLVMPFEEAGLRKASQQVADELGIETVHFVRSRAVTTNSVVQIVVGPATLQISDEEAVAAFARLWTLCAYGAAALKYNR